jgi:hypothetical protein
MYASLIQFLIFRPTNNSKAVVPHKVQLEASAKIERNSDPRRFPVHELIQAWQG